MSTHAYAHTSMAQLALQRSSHLQLSELLSLVAGVLCIDELGEEELSELGALIEASSEAE